MYHYLWQKSCFSNRCSFWLGQALSPFCMPFVILCHLYHAIDIIFHIWGEKLSLLNSRTFVISSLNWVSLIWLKFNIHEDIFGCKFKLTSTWVHGCLHLLSQMHMSESSLFFSVGLKMSLISSVRDEIVSNIR